MKDADRVLSDPGQSDYVEKPKTNEMFPELHYTTLYSTILYQHVLHYIILYSTIIYHTILYCAIPYYTILFHSILLCVTLVRVGI